MIVFWLGRKTPNPHNRRVARPLTVGERERAGLVAAGPLGRVVVPA